MPKKMLNQIFFFKKLKTIYFFLHVKIQRKEYFADEIDKLTSPKENFKILNCEECILRKARKVYYKDTRSKLIRSGLPKILG